MPICGRCGTVGAYNSPCPSCGTWIGSPEGVSVGRFGRYGLVIGMVLSIIGVAASLIAGAVCLWEGYWVNGLLSILVAAPYSYAMFIVFRYVWNRRERAGRPPKV